MSERMTEDARKAMVLAQAEALQLGHDRVNSEHLLLGLLGQEASFAAQALSYLGVTLQDAREQITGQMLTPADHANETSNVRQLRPENRPPEHRHGESLMRRPQTVLERAARQAEIFGHYYVKTPHLLLGLVEGSEGRAVRVLSSLGVEPPDVRRTVMEMLRSGEYGEKKHGGLHNLHRGGHRGGMIRLEALALADDKLARELRELLVLTGLVEIPTGDSPDENSSPKGLPSGEGPGERPGERLGERLGESTEVPGTSLDAELAARIERAVEELGSCIEITRNDLLGLKLAHHKLFELIDGREPVLETGETTDE